MIFSIGQERRLIRKADDMNFKWIIHVSGPIVQAYRTLNPTSVSCQQTHSFTLEGLELGYLRIFQPETDHKKQSFVHVLELYFATDRTEGR